jgi:hypothetical protein
MPKDPEPRVVPDFSHVWDKDPRRFSCCGGSKRIGDITVVVLVVQAHAKSGEQATSLHTRSPVGVGVNMGCTSIEFGAAKVKEKVLTIAINGRNGDFRKVRA